MFILSRKTIRHISKWLTVVMLFGLCSGALVWGTEEANAETVTTLTPVADAHVRSVAGRTNYNYGANGGVGISTTEIGYLKFDLSTVTSQVYRATLEVYLKNTNPETYTITAYPVNDDSWVEGTGDGNGMPVSSPSEGISYISAPPASGPALGTITLPYTGNAQSTGQKFVLDITDYVTNEYLNDPGKKVSIQLTSSGTSSIALYAKEHSTFPQQQAKLIISDQAEPTVTDIVVDNPDAEFTGTWSDSSTYRNNYYGSGYQSAEIGTGENRVIWRPNLAEEGFYAVYYWLPDGMDSRASKAPYTIYYKNGSKTYYVNQQPVPGGNWLPLGTHYFEAGTSGYVELSNDVTPVSGEIYIIADAVRFVLVPPPPPPPAPGTIATISDFGTGNVGNIRIVEFDATPSLENINSIIGLGSSNSAPASSHDFPVAIRFNDQGNIDAAAGDTYSAMQTVTYSVYDQHHVKLAVNLPMKSYDAWVTPSGGSPIQIAKDYPFAANGMALDNIGKLYSVTYSEGLFTIENPRLITDSIHGGKPGDPQFTTHRLESDNTGSKVLRFDLTPLTSTTNEVIGFSGYRSNVSAFGNMPMLFRMYNGFFDAYNNAASPKGYGEENMLEAVVGTRYHIKVVPDFANKTYSIWAAPEGGSPVLIADHYAFRDSAPYTDNLGSITTNTGDFGEFQLSHILTVDAAQLAAAVNEVNNAATVAEMKAALTSNALGLSMDNYWEMTEGEKDQLADDLLKGIPYEDEMAIQAAFDDPTSVLPDLEPPSAPTDLTAVATDLMQVKLTWTASTDDSGVKYYKVFRDGSEIATVTSGTVYVDSWLSPSTTYEYVVKAYDRVPREAVSAPVTVTTGEAGQAFHFPFSKEMLDSAFSKQLLKYALTNSNVPIPGTNPVQYYKMYADAGSTSRAFALYYLTLASSYSPDFMASNGVEVYKQALAHIRSAIAGGNEPGLSGSGLEAIQYLPFLQSIVIAKNKVPEIWNDLTPDEKHKIDLIMQANLIAAHWAYSDLHNFPTGLDQAGNFGKDWNPNYRQGGVGAAIASALYLGADNANAILKNFDYDSFIADLNANGLTNIATIFGNTGKALLEQYTKDDGPEGFTYKGHTLHELGLWLKELTDYTFSEPVLPVGGGTVPVSTTNPFGYLGYMKNGYDEFPNLGALGMGREFESTDANGKRTSLSYVYFGWQSAIQNMYAIKEFGGSNSGLTSAEMTAMFNKMEIGTTDMLYKDANGYFGYEKGAAKDYSLSASGGNTYPLQKELWFNVINNPTAAVQSANEAEDALAMKAVIESDELNLVKYGYDALSPQGKEAVAQAVLANRPAGGYYNKNAIQNELYSAVKAEGIKALNSASTIDEMKAALKSNALGLYIPHYDALNEEHKGIAAQTLIDFRPEAGFASKREIITQTAFAVKDAQQPERKKLKNLPAAPFGVPRIDLLAYDKWPENHGDAQVALWNDDKTGAVSLTIDDNFVNEHNTWLGYSNEYGINFTWFAITGGNGYDPAKFTTLLAEGQDVQSHTDQHIGSANRTEQEFITDYTTAINKINALPGGNAKTLAYPSGVGNFDIASRYYIAARGVQGFVNAPDTLDYMHVSSYSVKSDSAFNSLDTVIGAVIDPANSKYRGWASFHTHSIAGADPVIRHILDSLTQNKDQIWAGTFTQLAMYAQERDSSKLQVTVRDADRIAFSLADMMDDALFDYPLTVKVRVNNNWDNIVAKQNGVEIPVTVVTHDSRQYALVKAVPDRGEVELVGTISGSNQVPSAIVVSTDSVHVSVGQSTAANATIYDQNDQIMSGLPVVWGSDHPEIASVDGNGMITGMSVGQTVVRAVYDELNASIQVTVTPAAAATATLTGAEWAEVGETYTLTYGLAGATNIAAQDITFNYDSQVFELIGEELLAANTVIAGTDAPSPGTVRYLLATTGEGNALNGNVPVLKLILKAEATSSGSKIEIAEAVLVDGNWNEVQIAPLHKMVAVFDRSALESVVQMAQDLLDSAVEGYADGQYVLGAKAALQTAIEEAQEVLGNPDASQAELNQAIEKLNQAVDVFRSKEITALTGDLTGTGGAPDGRISISDLGFVAVNYGKTSEDPDWAEAQTADIDGNGVIDIYDLAFVARRILAH